MAAPWLSLLPKAARIFYPIALKGVAEGLSANRILSAYSAARPGLRRTLGLEVIRKVRGVERSARAFKGLRLDLHPDVARIPTAIHKTWRNYSYHVEFHGVTSQGKSVTAGVTVASDTVITRGEAEAMAASFLEEAPADYGIESIDRIQLVGIKKSPLLG